MVHSDPWKPSTRGRNMIRTRTIRNPHGLPVEVSATVAGGLRGKTASLRLRWADGTFSPYRRKEKDGVSFGLIAAVATTGDLAAVAALLDWFEENDRYAAEKINTARAKGGEFPKQRRAKLVMGEW